jgi:hypothetical protein
LLASVWAIRERHLFDHDTGLIWRRHARRLHREQPALSELTIGFWQNEYIKRKAFNGIGGTPSTDEDVIMTSVRYYPF